MKEAEKLLPDVLLLDISIPLKDGLTVARMVRRHHPQIVVLLMSEREPALLAHLAEAAETQHYVAKSRLAFELIPILTALVKDE